MSIKTGAAEDIITFSLGKKGLKTFETVKGQDFFFKNCDSSIILDVKGWDIEMAFIDIRDNYFKRAVTHDFIIDYPRTKFVPSKKTGAMPLKIKIPRVLSSILSDKVKEDIINAWRKKYSHFSIGDYKVLFES